MMWGIGSRQRQSLHDICCSELPLEKKKRQIDRFLAQGGSINERQRNSANVLGLLTVSTEAPDTELVRYLLDKGAFIEQPGDLAHCIMRSSFSIWNLPSSIFSMVLMCITSISSAIRG
ncbi:hypothetical protein [Pectobacterium wasabiae]|uniref:hypothetical protein n=1 Tax=Pectobacterium wasabiae TaxID=55208 RepID=UPI000AB455D4|nr:hypothetical protein [Pectobacterium wasabiae]